MDFKVGFKPKLFSTFKNGYSKQTLVQDLLAGVIVGIVALPLAIAFGIASGASPEAGILTAIVAGFIISFFGGSKVQIGGPYFFGIGNKFEEMMGDMGGRAKVRIIRMRKVPFIDSTGVHNLSNMCRMCAQMGVKVVLSGVNPTVMKVLENAGMDDVVGKENICSHISLALKRAEEILAEA